MALKVLIVDDSQIMRDVMQKFLAGFDLEIAGTARDGEEAIKLFRDIHPDIVTLDITMPRIDGLAALKEMKKIRPEAQVMIVSAINDKSVVLKALDAGAALFINKPVSAEAVKTAITKLLSQRQP
ncbi:response regulator [Turneriella parva]|uniref:Response regulator receiver protein n=1 Tax=Turneriella parva (strain ATCC BAA-1111 / DSM 21527 / NCTC 11395 / H) TaxID=869212 RepID=I4B6Z3_TURPD|nr:response regulator [Turneriella parva]AFM13050.1 response regulator receiver protein [Turneriella parva DSM 21527]